jgi:hypothetical protein
VAKNHPTSPISGETPRHVRGLTAKHHQKTLKRMTPNRETPCFCKGPREVRLHTISKRRSRLSDSNILDNRAIQHAKASAKEHLIRQSRAARPNPNRPQKPYCLRTRPKGQQHHLPSRPTTCQAYLSKRECKRKYTKKEKMSTYFEYFEVAGAME